MNQVISNEEAARLIGCSPATLRVWVSKRRVPHLKIGRLVRFRESDLTRFIEEHVVQVTAAK